MKIIESLKLESLKWLKCREFWIAVVGFAFIIVCGCSASHEEVTGGFSLPPELKDYKIVRLASDTGNHLYVLVKKDGEDRPVIGTTYRK